MIGFDTFFSIKGRISRLSFWVGHIVQLLLLGGLLGLGVLLERGSNEPSQFSSVFMIVFFLLFFWTGLCINGKRWHDRDKSAWWILIGLIPGIGLIWVIVENGCLQGTQGPNRFGDDPLAT